MRAILGRETLTVAEVRRMLASENVYRAARSYAAAENGAEWAAANRRAAATLAWAERALAESEEHGE